MKSEDGIVVTADVIAVIVGSTSKTQLRHSMWRSNGRYSMQLISRYVSRMPKDITCQEFLRGVTACIRKHYKRSQMSRLAEHPEDRLTASVAVYSRVSREIWMVGDCQSLMAPLDTRQSAPAYTYYDNPKPAEAALAAQRADEVKRLLAQGVTREELLLNDTARPVIIPHMTQPLPQQNISYTVRDGLPIPPPHARSTTLASQPW